MQIRGPKGLVSLGSQYFCGKEAQASLNLFLINLA